MRGAFLFWLMAMASAFAVETPAPSRIVEIERDKEWVVDAAGHPWMVPSSTGNALKEWDGTKWITHDFPPGVRCWVGLHVDDQGRIWVNTELAPVSIYDPRSDQWQTFPNLEEAFLASKDKPVRFLHNRWSLAPQYSGDQKRMAYRWQVISISYYNGTTWQRWGRKDITGTKGDDNTVGPPWFDEEGKLRVNIKDGTSWRLDDSGKWLLAPWTSHFPGDAWSEQDVTDRRPVAPEGSVPAERDTVVVDNLGITWLISKGLLYKAIAGLCVPVFGPDEVTPFRSMHNLQEVYVDPQGNAFLLTAASGMARMMIRPKSPAPVTHVVMNRQGEDSFVARFDAQTKQTVAFRWQLDDGAWEMSKINSLALDHLPNGAHVLNVIAIDDQLNMDTIPATARFETKIDSNRQMALLVAQLFDPDFSKRKIAVTVLARQPAVALPALRKARETATDDQRWWIDATLQEIENRKSATPTALKDQR